jgi:hypothetical protein
VAGVAAWEMNLMEAAQSPLLLAANRSTGPPSPAITLIMGHAAPEPQSGLEFKARFAGKQKTGEPVSSPYKQQRRYQVF